MTPMEKFRIRTLGELDELAAIIPVLERQLEDYREHVRAKARRLDRLGVPKTDIAEHAGVSRQTIHHYLRKGGD